MGSRSSTEHIKLGFGVTLMPFGFIHPARVAEKVATVDVLSHGRVEWGTGRSTPMEQVAFGVPDRRPQPRRSGARRSRSSCGMWENETFSWDSENLQLPGAHADAEAVPGPAPAGVAGGRDRRRARSAPASSGSACCRSRCCSRSRRWPTHIEAYRSAQALARAEKTCSRASATTASASYTLVHCYDDADEAADYGLWESVNWWYKHLAEFTLQWELPDALRGGAEGDLPAPRAGHRRRGRPCSTTRTRT